ncbi:hypothetical protein BGZ80_003376 [Entomortierella chlamydospora]|uniref:Uncharacterized protein n=1 Tax=Entomortierella chlamydospora TaxID=101097 RepID=A0A9P6N276_9FUNG|nr:hypothetical protein BGZ79_007262 [Entomortierella chlamydospora]KAG0020905.1 hypothetical protein BGZ80_003376 [Entomortierella chlamydospora]
MRDNPSPGVQVSQDQHRNGSLASLLGDDSKRKTLVCFDSIVVLRSVQDELVRLRPVKIGAYYSTLRAEHKQDTMSKETNVRPKSSSLVQRFGRAVRDPLLMTRGIVTLLAPLVTSSKYSKRLDLKKLVQAAKDMNARQRCWELIAKRFDIAHRCNQSCEGCTGSTFSARFPICLSPAAIKIPTGKRTDEEKQVGRRKLQGWRKKTYKKWAGEDEPMTDGETWILPDSAVDKLCKRLFHAATANGVRRPCSHLWVADNGGVPLRRGKGHPQ